MKEKNYELGTLSRSDLDEDPFAQFLAWFEEAIDKEVLEPHAMALSTATKKGTPSCRYVLLKKVNKEGFIFFTNYESRKSQELFENPQAFITFWWKELERQVCVEGIVEKVSSEKSLSYFSKRPRKSQLSALASKQDVPIESREVLEAEVQRLEEFYGERPIPLPPFWGGFCLKPTRFEFWQGREDRLHDRFEYKKEKEAWVVNRLSP